MKMMEWRERMIRWWATWSEDGSLEPLYEIEDRGDAYVLTFDLPYVRKEDIEVNVTEDTVEVSAKMREAVLWERWGCVQRRISFKSFSKTVKLPEPVDPDKSQARLREGILIIFLPKKKRKVEIKVE